MPLKMHIFPQVVRDIVHYSSRPRDLTLESQLGVPGIPKYRHWTVELRDGDDDASERRCWLRTPDGFRGVESFISFERWEECALGTRRPISDGLDRTDGRGSVCPSVAQIATW